MKGLTLNNSSVSISNDIDALAYSLERLYFVGMGECLGNLSRCSRIPEYMYEPQIPSTANGIINEVVILTQMYEPRIDLTAVGVEFVDRGCIITIEFYWMWDDDKKQKQTLSLSSPT